MNHLWVVHLGLSIADLGALSLCSFLETQRLSPHYPLELRVVDPLTVSLREMTTLVISFFLAKLSLHPGYLGPCVLVPGGPLADPSESRSGL